MKQKVKTLLALALMLITAVSFSMGANTDSTYAASKPAKVTSVKVSVLSTSSVKITWNKAKRAQGYVVYRGEKAIKRTTALAFTDTKLKAGTKYTYKVRAYNTYKQKQWYNKKTKKWVTKEPKKKYRGKKRYVTKYRYGSFSLVRTIRTKKATPASTTTTTTSGGSSDDSQLELMALDTDTEASSKPKTPANIKASSTTTSVTLSWSPVAGAESYYINSTVSSLKRGVTTTSCTIDGLTSNTEYTFYVQSIVDGKYSAKLDGKVVVKTKKEGLQSPTNIKVSSITSKTAVLTWDAVTGADSYQICDANKNVIDTVTSRTYMLKGLKENTAQTFYVTAGKSGTYGVIDDENKAQFSTISMPRSFTKNSNISLTYKGVKFCLGDTWNDTLLGKLKAASNGYEKVERPKFVYDGDTLSNATLHMFDIDDYSDFLSVLVVNKKIVRWDTNGDVFGMYYGTEVRWGDVTSKYMFGKNTSYRTTACDEVLTELDMGDTVVGGFAFYLSLNTYELNIDSEKRIGLHYVNAFRAAANLVPFEYSDALDGHEYTWSGTDRNGKFWPAGTRYGAQPFAETVAASNAKGHTTGSMPNGPCAGQTGLDRGAILQAATGVLRNQENEASGLVGECFLTGFQGSDAHFANIVYPGFTKIGFGMSDGIVTELFAY